MDVVAEYKAARDYMRTGLYEVFGEDFVGKINALLYEAGQELVERMHRGHSCLLIHVPAGGFCSFKITANGDESDVLSCNYPDSVGDAILTAFDGILADTAKQEAFLRLLIQELVK